MDDKDFKNLKIGSKFTLGNRILEVKKDKHCSNKCFFRNLDLDCEDLQNLGMLPYCYKYHRDDGENIIFEEVEDESME